MTGCFWRLERSTVGCVYRYPSPAEPFTLLPLFRSLRNNTPTVQLRIEVLRPAVVAVPFDSRSWYAGAVSIVKPFRTLEITMHIFLGKNISEVYYSYSKDVKHHVHRGFRVCHSIVFSFLYAHLQKLLWRVRPFPLVEDVARRQQDLEGDYDEQEEAQSRG